MMWITSGSSLWRNEYTRPGKPCLKLRERTVTAPWNPYRVGWAHPVVDSPVGATTLLGEMVFGHVFDLLLRDASPEFDLDAFANEVLAQASSSVKTEPFALE